MCVHVGALRQSRVGSFSNKFLTCQLISKPVSSSTSHLNCYCFSFNQQLEVSENNHFLVFLLLFFSVPEKIKASVKNFCRRRRRSLRHRRAVPSLFDPFLFSLGESSFCFSSYILSVRGEKRWEVGERKKKKSLWTEGPRCVCIQSVLHTYEQTFYYLEDSRWGRASFDPGEGSHGNFSYPHDSLYVLLLFFCVGSHSNDIRRRRRVFFQQQQQKERSLLLFNQRKRFRLVSHTKRKQVDIRSESILFYLSQQGWASHCIARRGTAHANNTFNSVGIELARFYRFYL